MVKCIRQSFTVGKGPGYVFADAGVGTTQVEAQMLDDLIDYLLKVKL
jgi:hypothetical protein